MALVLADRVLETSTSEGLGTFALAGAQTGYQTFSNGIGNGNTCYYTINGQTTEQWEVGIGTVSAGTLARTTLISSNTGSFINFVAGVKNVFVTQPASKSIYKDASGNAIPLGSASATQLDITAQGDLRLQDTTGGEYVALQAPATLASSYTLTMPTDDGTAGQALITDGSGVLSWSTAASGDVYGPASATDDAVARYDGTTGKIIQNSAVTIGDDGATVIAANSTSDGLRITQIGAGNAILVEDSANPDSSPFVITSAGNLFKGSTTSVTTIIAAGTQINGTGTDAYLELGRWSADAANPGLIFAKSRGAAVGTNTIVANNDNVGELTWTGADGSGFISAAQITAAVDGTPGTNDMPGRLVFSTTADGASSSTERMRIDSAGNVGVGGTPPAGWSVLLGKNITGAASSYGFVQSSTVLSDVTNAFIFNTNTSTQAAAFTLTGLVHFRASQSTIGATSAVTNQYGFFANSTLTGATNNYGFYGNIASGTNRFNFYAAGTADNYFAGNTAIGTTTTNNGYGGVASLNLRNASTITFNNASNTWNTSTAGGAITYFTDNALYIDAKDSTSQVIFRVNGATNRGGISSAGVWSLGAAAGSESLRVTPVSSAVNYWNLNGNVTGSAPALLVNGSDTNISAFHITKGTGNFGFYTGTTSGLTGAVQQFNITHTASAVNYLQVTGGATGSNPILSAQGSDANVNLVFRSKGTGVIANYTNTSDPQFFIAHTASAVNYHQMTGSATGTALVHSAQGSDTNIDLALTPKGTGVLKFGTYTAGIIAQAGYITIADAGGTTRRLLVG